jgi:hypothetical protein
VSVSATVGWIWRGTPGASARTYRSATSSRPSDIGRIAENWEDEELLRETADLMSELAEQAAASGELDWQDEHTSDAAFIRLMDSFADASHPAIPRLRKLIAERGWTGWTRIQKRQP